MASIEKRTSDDGKTSFRVKVRLKGFPTQTATFSRLTDARAWAQTTESDIKQGKYFPKAEARRHTLRDAIERYRKTHLGQKRSAHDQDRQLKWWETKLGEYRLCDITPALISE